MGDLLEPLRYLSSAHRILTSQGPKKFILLVLITVMFCISAELLRRYYSKPPPQN